jgi:hypothetical protein
MRVFRFYSSFDSGTNFRQIEVPLKAIEHAKNSRNINLKHYNIT